MIKPASQYNAPFEIEYDILKKLDDIENSGILVSGNSNVSGSSNTPCNCSNDSSEMLTALYAIKTSIDNKEISNQIIKETIIEKPVEVVKEVEVIKTVYVPKPVEKIIEKKIYIEKPIGNCSCNHTDCTCNHEHIITVVTGTSYNTGVTPQTNKTHNNFLKEQHEKFKKKVRELPIGFSI